MAGFQEVKVNRDLVFCGAAAYQPNVKGPLMTELKIADYGFEGTSTLYGWSSTTGSYGGLLAQGSVDGGAMTLTAGATANDLVEFYHTAQYSPYFNCGMEAKLKISAITNVGVCVGFVDAITNTNDRIAMEMTLAALTNCINTADLAGMVFDTQGTTKVWYCGTSNNGSEATPVAAVGSLAPVADTYFKVRVQTDTDGNVTFYYNGKAVGYKATGLAYAVGNLLTPYIGFISRSTGAPVCTVSRVTVWQDN